MNMDKIKPGQFYWHNKKVLLRAKKKHNGCEGCILDHVLLCPNIVLSNQKNQELVRCEDVIFVKV